MIGETVYELSRVAVRPAEVYRLEKGDGTLYDIIETEFGPTCDCADFVFRRDGKDPAGCKHVKLLVDAGLVEALRWRQ